LLALAAHRANKLRTLKMTKGKCIAMLIHFTGLSLAMGLLLFVTNQFLQAINREIIIASAVIYFGAVAWVTVRVLRGKDSLANKAAALVDGGKL